MSGLMKILKTIACFINFCSVILPLFDKLHICLFFNAGWFKKNSVPNEISGKEIKLDCRSRDQLEKQSV